MNRSLPHPYFAWFIDVWLLVTVLRLAELLAPSVSKGTGLAISVAWLAAVLALLQYQLKWSASTRFLSFGERVAGKVLENGVKVWGNPYSRSRNLLYFTMVGMLWFKTTKFPASPLHLPTQAVAVAVATISMLLIGRGIAWGLTGVWVHRILEYIQQWPLERLLSEPTGLPQFDLLGVGIACLVVAFYYSDVWRSIVSRRVTP